MLKNSNSPVRIAMIMGKMIGGGVESVVMNYYENIDRNKYQFDFIIDSDSTNIPEEKIRFMGGRIYKVSPYQNIFKYNRDLRTIFYKNNYKIVHSHINSLSLFPLRIANECKIPIRIAHNHSTAAPGEFKKNILKNILKVFSNVYPNYYMAPTLYAGKWLFGENIDKKPNFLLLPNAISISKFKFSEVKRNLIRKKLNIEKDTILLGNIGRLVWQKNQLYILEILREIKKSNTNTKLLIIGEGPLKKELEDKILDYSLKNSVIFLENLTNVSDYYSAFDIFLFPSNYEGLGMVAVEAQIAKLPVLASTSVPKDACISKELYSSLDIKKEDANKWSEKCLDIIHNQEKKMFFRNNYENIYSENYDITVQSEKLTDFYDNCIKYYELQEE